MSRSTRSRIELLWEQLMMTGDGAPSAEEKVLLVQALRKQSEEDGLRVDRALVEEIGRLRTRLGEVDEIHKELKAAVEKMTATPWYPAVFLRMLDTPLGSRALVQCSNSRRLVEVAEKLDVASLGKGEEVFLNNALNAVMAPAGSGVPRCGEIAALERETAEGRLVLRWRDEQVVVEPAYSLQRVQLVAGDLVRWDRNLQMAFERMPREEGSEYFLPELPEIGPEAVGGQDAGLDRLLAVLTGCLLDPDKAARYGAGARSALLVGPPGVGKTLMARVGAAEVSRIGGRNCRFALVQPAQWESPWVGEAERNIRNCFRAIRKAAEDGPVILFLDEVEAAGRIRGSLGGLHADKFLSAFLAEVDGFGGRAPVAIVAATNRKDLLDPAVAERLCETEIEVKRPDLEGARAIFGIHLRGSYPYSPNGTAVSATRAEIIETAVSRLYSPNGDAELCVLKLRDNTRRTVRVRDLVSGRLIRQICRAAVDAAYLRDVRTGEPGVRMTDMEEAVSDVLQRLRTTLSPRNAHAYLADLPQDVDVVSVEPIARKVPHPHRYLMPAEGERASAGPF